VLFRSDAVYGRVMLQVSVSSNSSKPGEAKRHKQLTIGSRCCAGYSACQLEIHHDHCLRQESAAAAFTTIWGSAATAPVLMGLLLLRQLYP
jgi:hypothetical protein